MNYLIPAADPKLTLKPHRWHTTRPTDPADRVGIDHVILAFAPSASVATYEPYVNISTIRSEFPNAKVLIAIGGWGDNAGFDEAMRNYSGIAKFAQDVQTMLNNTGADGVGELPLFSLLSTPPPR